MVINHNIAALNTFSNLQKNTNATQDSLQKLSTGSKINKAADDASGLAISQKMQAQINGLDQAQENVSNGNSLIQTAEGALGNTQDILQKMRTLAVQAQNDTQNDTDKSNLQDQANALAQEINRISTQTAYNTKDVFGNTNTQGLFSNSGLQVQIGADSGQTIALSLKNTVIASSTLVSATTSGIAAGTTTYTLTGDAASGYQVTVGTATYSVALNTAGTQATFTDAQGNAVKDGSGTAGAILNNFTATVSQVVSGSTTLYQIDAHDLFSTTSITATTIDTTSTGVQDTADATDVFSGKDASANGQALVQLGGTGPTYTLTLTDAQGTALTAGAISSIAANATVNYTLTDQNGQTVKDANGNTAVYAGQDATGQGKSVGTGTVGGINITSGTSYVAAVDVSALGVGTGIGEAATAISLTGSNAINTIQTAIDTVSKLRSKLGAYQNRFSYAGDTLNIESQNLTAAESTITDTDVAKEMMNYTKNNILVQSAQAMLAQANQLPQGMLSLLKS